MRAFTILKNLLPFFPLSSAQFLRPRVLTRDSSSSESDFDWSSITPSSNIEWVKCYQDFTCARLEVPLDYGDHSKGKTAVAFIKFAAKNATSNTKNLLVNPGGPGESGIDLALGAGSMIQEIFGDNYNIVGFDPRGVSRSGPVIDCWPNHPERRGKFETFFYPEVANASTTALRGVDGNASFISTPAVAQDMLTYAKTEQIAAGKSSNDAKVAYYGLSYGTVLGATFASMFPDNVERMVLDGVFALSDYYDGAWKTSVYDTDKALASFSRYCYQGGKENCSFWGPSVSNITTRLNNIFADLKYNPIPIPSTERCSVPTMATYSELKQMALEIMYSPSEFPTLADAFSDLERRNTSGYLTVMDIASGPVNPCSNGTDGSSGDPLILIKCVDAWDGLKFDDIEQYRQYVNDLEDKSPFFGEVWPQTAATVLCRSLDAIPPKSARVTGSMMETRNTSFPILFITSEIDPVTPRRE
ncbi:hypothetical protein N7478_001310 [Penicillium angulare]|uniref:uncharacterized protein n=1 Tax=Penicillium angulare TaxID=116970 RepID=UPI002541749D|nr:uncharacterized protein N7478_001310 [Penicillium angulare]KAJ5292059.1 hypothetical protein N7478_001310 [Penicillium angulare]